MKKKDIIVNLSQDGTSFWNKHNKKRLYILDIWYDLVAQDIPFTAIARITKENITYQTHLAAVKQKLLLLSKFKEKDIFTESVIEDLKICRRTFTRIINQLQKVVKKK